MRLFYHARRDDPHAPRVGLAVMVMGARSVLPAALIALLGYGCSSASRCGGSSAAAPAFSATGGMNSRREGHRATLLPSGQVLVVGGFTGTHSPTETAWSSAELYDPGSGTFT